MKACVVLLTCLMLSACGFHLKDHWTVAQQYRCLELTTPDHYSTFTRKLTQALIENHVVMTPSNKRCPSLHITRVDIRHDAPTIGTSSTARVYRYYIKVQYHLNDRPAETIVATRFTTLNAGILTTTNNQIYLVEQALVDDAVRQMMYRLSTPRMGAFSRHPRFLSRHPRFLPRHPRFLPRHPRFLPRHPREREDPGKPK